MVFSHKIGAKMKKGAPLSLLLGGGSMAEQYTKFDNECPGLGVRVNPSGSSVYVLKYRWENKQKLVTLCSTNDLSLDEARDIGCEVKNLIRRGEDPLHHLADMLPGRKRAKPLTMRFKEFAELYMKRHAIEHNKRWYDEDRRIKVYLVPTFGEMRLHEITRADVAKMHYEIGLRAKYQANRVKDLLKTMLNKARLWEMLPESVANPAEGVKNYREKPREKYITKGLMAQLVKGIEAVPNPTVRAYYWILMLTGCRMQEIMPLLWEHVNLQEGIITIIDPKNGKTLRHPVSEQVLYLLKALREAHPTSRWVFPSHRFPDQPYRKLNGSWLRILDEAGLSEFNIHDLRKTCGSWLAQDGHSLHLVAKALNQTTPHVTARYAQLEKSDVRNALQTFADKVDDYRQKKDHA